MTAKIVKPAEGSSEFIARISREYGIYTLEGRAIPSMTDGLKTSQRIALWLIRTKDSEVKTISLAGEMISSKLYVHGDASAAETISYLAAPYLNNHTMIQGEGQFGSRAAPSDGIGAPRYTEVKRSDFARKHLYVDTDILPMVENYDGSVLMPGTFLPLLPLVLLNGVKGIGTGWATLILPRRLSDLQKAVQEVLEHGKVRTKLMPHYERYDVDVIQDHANPSRYIIRGKLKIKNTSTVQVTELPPDLTLEKFRDHLIQLEDEGKIKDFTDSTTDRIDIDIKMSRMALEKHTEDSLIELFKLRSYKTENLIVLDPSGTSVKRYATAEKLIEDFVQWRLGWFRRRYEVKHEQEQAEALFWRTFVACFPDVAKKVSGYKNREALRVAIRGAATDAGVDTTDEIVDKIAGLPVYGWTKEGRSEAEAKLKQCEADAQEYARIAADENRQKSIYQEEVA